MYPSFEIAIADLHHRGFNQDFVLFDDVIFWTQEKLFIATEDFSIEECHVFAFPPAGQKEEELVLFGISAISGHVRGILMNHYSYTSPRPPVITKKIFEMEYH